MLLMFRFLNRNELVSYHNTKNIHLLKVEGYVRAFQVDALLSRSGSSTLPTHA